MANTFGTGRLEVEGRSGVGRRERRSGCRGRPGLAEMRIEGNVGAYTRKASEGAERERGRGERIGFPRRFDKAAGRPFRPRVRNAVQHPRGSLSVSIAFSFALTSTPCLTSSYLLAFSPLCFVHAASCSLSLSLSCAPLTHMPLLFVSFFTRAVQFPTWLANILGGVVFETKILLYTFLYTEYIYVFISVDASLI